MRTIVFGDVHGCNTALTALLKKTEPCAEKDRLVFLGDLFDRGPDSFEVLQTVKKLAADFQENFVLILGNHEDYLLQEHLTFRQRRIWEKVGRQSTVLSFRRNGSRMEDAVPWIREHVRLYWKTEGFQCVHAGLLLDPPEINDRRTLVHDHGIVPENRYSGPLTITGHIALEKATWFAGDRATTAEPAEGTAQSLPGSGVLCIDTGCGKGGRLTAMIAEGNTYMLLSVPENPK